MALWDYMHLPCNGRYLPCGCYALIWRVYHYMQQSHIVIWQMMFIINSFGNLIWSPAIQWFSFENNIYYKVVTFKVVFIIIYFLLCFLSACYPLAIYRLIWQVLGSVFGNLWWYGKSYICLLRIFRTCCYLIKLDERGGFIFFLCCVCLLYCNTLDRTMRDTNQTRTNLV